MTDLQTPASITFEGKQPLEEKQGLHFNMWAGIYLVAVLVYLFMFYTEITGKWLTEPEKTVEADPVQRVPVEQPEGKQDDE